MIRNGYSASCAHSSRWSGWKTATSASTLGVARGVEFVAIELLLEVGQCGQIVAHQPRRRLMQVDQLDPGHGVQHLLGGFHHAGDAGMAVQRDPHLDALAQQRAQLSETIAQEEHERRHLERPRAAHPLDLRHRHFADLDLAGRTPRDHLSGLALRQLVDRRLGHPAVGLGVARAQPHHAAAMGRPAHHLPGHAERVHDVEREQRDVRRLQHIAAGVEHEVRPLRSRARAETWASVGHLSEPLEQRIVELHLGEIAHVAIDQAERLDAALAQLGRGRLRFGHGGARDREQEARVDAVVAGAHAVSAHHAGVRPVARGFVAAAVAQDVDDAVDHGARRGGDAARSGDRTGLDALAATRTGVEHRVDAVGQGLFESDGHADSRPVSLASDYRRWPAGWKPVRT